MEQFLPLRDRSGRTRRDRIQMDRKEARKSRRTASTSYKAIPLKPKSGVSGAPGDRAAGWLGPAVKRLLSQTVFRWAPWPTRVSLR